MNLKVVNKCCCQNYLTLRDISVKEYLLFQETTECRAMGGEKSIESDMDQDSSDDEMYVEETSDDDDEEDEAPTRHRLERDDGL